MDKTQEDELLTIQEAVDMLDMSRSTIYRLIEEGLLHPQQAEDKPVPTSKIRLPLSEVQALKPFPNLVPLSDAAKALKMNRRSLLKQIEANGITKHRTGNMRELGIT